MYITPITKIYSSFAEAKDDVDKFGHSSFFDDRKVLTVRDLAQGKRNLVVGEPGVGKSELLKKLQEHHEAIGDEACLVNLRIARPSEAIDEFLNKKVTNRRVLILDALDEVRSAIFADLLQKIEAVSEANPDLIIYLSSRWIFASRYEANFPEYRFIRIMPFSMEQVRNYLVQSGNTQTDVDALLARIMQFSHGQLVVQIPRYLFFLVKFIKDKTIGNVSQVSRNELFEYFIYSKLDIEDKKLNTDSKAVIKRILEKLALTMEIYQANTITKDELMTFFDDIDSDLKMTVLSHISLDVFFAKTILQESKQDLDSIEFENAEFQEYLAAKEISRFAEPHHVAFTFAVDENVEEILPSWFNTLTFLVDMIPEILEQLLEFSGLRSGKFKIADEGFLNFLSRVNPTYISPDFRKRIFMDVIQYHQKTRQWLTGQLVSALPGFFSPELEFELKSTAEEFSTYDGSSRYVPLANIAYVVAYLFEQKIPLDTPYWREKLISYAKDVNDNGVLQRHAFVALEKLGDQTVIDELSSDFTSDDELVSKGFVSMCIDLNPEHPTSLKYAIETVKRNDFSGRYGLFEIKERASIITFLNAYNSDEIFRKEFLDDTSIFGEKDSVLVSNIASVLDEEIKELCIEAIVKSVETHVYRSNGKSAFVNGLIILLKKQEPDFIAFILQRIKGSDNGSASLYFAQDTFSEILEKEDISPYLDAMIGADDKRTAFNTMVRIKYSKRESCEEIFEAGRSKLSSEYAQWEQAQTNVVDSVDNSRNEQILKEFRTSLEPTPGQYMTSVFHYYVNSAELLDTLMDDNDRTRLMELVTGSVLKFNPAEHGLTIQSQHNDGNGGTKTYTSSQIAHMFGDALLAAQRLGIDVTPYRSNIALHIPFAYDNELKATFEMIKDFTQAELEPVIQIYRERKTDLWRHQPESFIDLVQTYHLTQAVPILKDFIKETEFRSYVRIEALKVTDSLMPDADFLWEIFNLYISSSDEKEKDIAYAANGLLITAHTDSNAVDWRLEEIKNRIFAFTSPRSGMAHTVGPRENELNHDKPFAKPLSDLRHSGFELKYLEILDKAIETWGQGKEFHAYAQYMWEIVYSHFENLKEHKSYKPLKLIEERIASLKDKDGANWLASSMVRLRRSYLMHLGKPKNFSEAIRRYNEARTYRDKNIRNSADLFNHIHDIVHTDLRNWVEQEGAYNIIVSKKKYKKNREYEKLVQMTIKSELSNICRGRGLKIDIAREEQLLNGKRTDFILRYGFVGPIVLEVKLGSNSDLSKLKLEESDSYVSMGNYMSGYGASHGMFLIMDDVGKPRIQKAIDVFGKIPNVTALSLDCHTPANLKKVLPKKKVAKKIIKKTK
jgi:guanylate kinase